MIPRPAIGIWIMICPDGLTKLSDAARGSLRKHKGVPDLDNLPDSAAQILRDAGHG